jgi:hypothetical protein
MNNTSFMNLTDTPQIPLYIAVQLENSATRARIWLQLPVTKERFANELAKIGAANSGFSVVDYACKAPMTSVYKLLRTPLASVNHLAARLNKFTPDEIAKLCAVSDTDYYFDGVAKLIEFTYHTDDVTLLPGITNEETLGEFHLGSFNNYVGGIALKQCVNRREFGAKLAELEKGAFTPWGYITSKRGWDYFRNPPRLAPPTLNLKGYIGEDLYGNFDEGDYDYGN